jgi:hypothetical protein
MSLPIELWNHIKRLSVVPMPAKDIHGGTASHRGTFFGELHFKRSLPTGKRGAGTSLTQHQRVCAGRK